MRKKSQMKKLVSLHEMVIDTLAVKIKDGTADAAMLNVARQILKDNHISGLLVTGSPLERLQTAVADTLPFKAEEYDEIKETA